jgi:hypothetical protein
MRRPAFNAEFRKVQIPLNSEVRPFFCGPESGALAGCGGYFSRCRSPSCPSCCRSGFSGRPREMLVWPGKSTSHPSAPWGTSCCLPTIPGSISPKSHPPCGAASWTTPLASAFSWSPTSPCIAATPPCMPSSSTACPCQRSPSGSVRPTTPCAPGCATSAPLAVPAKFPPFRRATPGPAGPRRQPQGTGPAP